MTQGTAFVSQPNVTECSLLDIRLLQSLHSHHHTNSFFTAMALSLSWEFGPLPPFLNQSNCFCSTSSHSIPIYSLCDISIKCLYMNMWFILNQLSATCSSQIKQAQLLCNKRQGWIPFTNKLTNKLANLHVCKVRLLLFYMQRSLWQMLITCFVKRFLTLDIAMTLYIIRL